MNRYTPPTRPTFLNSNWLFQNSLIFIYRNSGYRLCDVISLIYCVISHVSPIFYHVFSFPRSNLWQDMNLFCLHLVFLIRNERTPILVAGALAGTFLFDWYFRSKILVNLTVNWKTRPNKFPRPSHTIAPWRSSKLHPISAQICCI